MTEDKNEDVNTKTDEPEKTKKSSHHKHGQLRRIVKRIALVVGPLCLIALFWLLVIHFTNIRHKLGSDPIEKGVETVQLKLAKSNVEKANAHLSVSENRFKNFRSSRTTASKAGYQNKLVTEMVEQNKHAIEFMDRAKKDGTDIKKLKLVERLCDLLGAQDKELKGYTTELTTQHAFASKLEDKVEGGTEVNKAIEEVQAELKEAMHW